MRDVIRLFQSYYCSDQTKIKIKKSMFFFRTPQQFKLKYLVAHLALKLLSLVPLTFLSILFPNVATQASFAFISASSSVFLLASID